MHWVNNEKDMRKGSQSTDNSKRSDSKGKNSDRAIAKRALGTEKVLFAF